MGVWDATGFLKLREEVALGDVEEFRREIFHLGGELAGSGGQMVIEDLRGYGDDDAEGGGDEGLGDTGSDGLDIRGVGGRESHKGGHHAPYRAEEADKRGSRGGGGEKRDALFKF